MLFRNNYAFLSNMYSSPMKVNGIYYTCLESAFQSFKLADASKRIQFAHLTGKDAKRLGRQVPLRPDWHEIKDKVMLELLRIKFRNPVLKAKLLSINEPIVEDNYWGDTYWGKCNGVGENKLGKLLTQVKGEIV